MAKLKSTCEVLESLCKGEAVGGQNMQAFLKQLKLSGHWTPKPVSGRKAVPLKLSGGYFKEEVKQFMRELVQDVTGGLQERFPDADVLNCFRIFDPKSYDPVSLGQPLDVFGKTELLPILNHVAKSTLSDKLPNLSKEQQQQLLTVEFPTMKQALWRKSREMGGLSMSTAWRDLQAEGMVRSMPNMFMLVQAGLVVLLNTACVERGFSHHGIIKNKLRNSRWFR